MAATQEVLRGLGVGDMNATFYGATVTWILKTVSGQLGGIAFAYSYGLVYIFFLLHSRVHKNLESRYSLLLYVP